MGSELDRRDVCFASEGVNIRGWLYLPRGVVGDVPGIVMAHGYGAVKEMCLAAFAESFARAGFAVLVFDFRGLGASDGTPRQEVNPAAQIEDYRNAITWLCAQPGVDAGRIGIWGSSYSGGHVLVLAATDRRVACVVAQIPTISGNAVTKRRFTPEALQAVVAVQNADRLARMAGKPPQKCVLASRDPADRPVYGAADAVEWYQTAGAQSEGNWKNWVTLRSLEYARAYEPGAYVPYIAPCPLLMIVAENDVVTPTDLAVESYASAGEPKAICMIPGGHFVAYGAEFDAASTAARNWFTAHLSEIS